MEQNDVTPESGPAVAEAPALFNYTFNNAHEFKRDDPGFREIVVEATGLADAVRKSRAQGGTVLPFPGARCVKFGEGSPEQVAMQTRHDSLAEWAEKRAERLKGEAERRDRARQIVDNIGDEELADQVLIELESRRPNGGFAPESWVSALGGAVGVDLNDWAEFTPDQAMAWQVPPGPSATVAQLLLQGVLGQPHVVDASTFAANPRETFQLGDGPDAQAAAYDSVLLQAQLDHQQAQVEAEQARKAEKKQAFRDMALGALYTATDWLERKLTSPRPAPRALQAFSGLTPPFGAPPFASVTPPFGAVAGTPPSAAGMGSWSPPVAPGTEVRDVHPQQPPAETLAPGGAEVPDRPVMPGEPF